MNSFWQKFSSVFLPLLILTGLIIFHRRLQVDENNSRIALYTISIILSLGFLFFYYQIFILRPLREELAQKTAALSDAEVTIEKQFENLEKAHKILEKELRLAKDIQSRLLSPDSPKEKSMKLHHFYRPGETLGGDYFDAFTMGSNYVVFIADVSGKGVSASLITSMLRALLRSLAGRTQEPGPLLTLLNAALYGHTGNRFVSAFLSVIDIDRKTIAYANAGHNCPILISRHGNTMLLNQEGMLLGIEQDSEYLTEVLSLKSLQRILYYTDGLINRWNKANEMYNPNRVADFCSTSWMHEGETFIALLLANAERFAPQHEVDDIAIVVIDL